MTSPWRTLILRASELLSSRRRKRPVRSAYKPTFSIEGLESREVLSTVAPTPIATLTGFITASKKSSLVFFQVNPGQFVSNGSMPMILGFQAQPTPGSTVTPRVSRIFHINGSNGHEIPSRSGIVFTKVVNPLTKPAIYSVRVKNLAPSTGGYQVQVTLTGDANNDGQVNRADIGLIRASIGSVEGQSSYNPNADFNKDGRVGKFDLLLARRNLGMAKSLVSLMQIPRPVQFR
jgi:hypothetical protein